MYPSKDARELAVLLRISRELDIVGDTSATIDNPSELLAWANILTQPDIVAWRAKDSGNRYLHVTAAHDKAPIRGRITAVLPGDPHADFWHALGLDHLAPGEQEQVSLKRTISGLVSNADHHRRPPDRRPPNVRLTRRQIE